MNQEDPLHGGEWPIIPDPEQPATGCRAMLSAFLCGAVLVISCALALFISRGCA